MNKKTQRLLHDLSSIKDRLTNLHSEDISVTQLDTMQKECGAILASIGRLLHEHVADKLIEKAEKQEPGAKDEP